jgi:MinD-like ATPase involved in chromosome partitioning or flagellar assembly
MDMDLEGPGLHVMFNIDPSKVQFTLNDVLLDSARPEQAAMSMNEKLGLKTGAVYFCPASVKVDDMLRTLRTGFEMESFSRALVHVQNGFHLDYILVDTHPGIEDDTLLAMGVCDELILICRIDHQDIFGTAVMVEVARSLEKNTQLIVNMIPQNMRESNASKLAGTIGANFNVPLLGWLPFSPDVVESLSNFVFFTAFPKHSMTTRFRELAARIERMDGEMHPQ